MDEMEWIRLAKEGDEAAFSHLVDRYCGDVFLTLLARTGDRDIAFSMTEQTFLQAWHAISLYDSDPEFPVWLNTLADNMCGGRSGMKGTDTPEDIPPQLSQAIMAKIRGEKRQFTPAAWLRRFRFTILALILVVVLFFISRCSAPVSHSAPKVSPPQETGPALDVDAAFQEG